MFFRRRTASAAPVGPAVLKADGQNAFRLRVRTARHGEVVELRLTKSGDISPEGDGTYFVRKQIIGPNSFDRATLEIRFGRNYASPQVTVEGGTAVPLGEWG